MLCGGIAFLIGAALTGGAVHLAMVRHPCTVFFREEEHGHMPQDLLNLI